MENPAATRAVRETAGLIVTFGGQPIDAFFFSTCGGRTERGTEVFRLADRPYLQSVSDLAPDGTAYCSISPRFRWREEFTGAALRQALRQYLPVTVGVPAARVTRVRDVRVDGRTISGRVRALSIELPDGFVSIPGPQVRQVLRQPSADILRSTLFTVNETRAGGQVTRLVIDGSGAGHGVGFCQWGAVGRARAGQTREQIIAAYFPGTGIERAY
jgi:stage II sporulation protein D